MPGLKRVLSSAFGMRKEAAAEVPLPARRHPLLKRSDALLKKKKKPTSIPAPADDASDDERSDMDGRLDESFADEPLGRLPNRRPWPDEFEAEMQAMARLKAERRSLYVLDQAQYGEGGSNGFWLPFHRKDISRARARLPGSIKSREEEDDSISPQYLHPLRAIRDGSVPEVRRYSSSVALQPRDLSHSDARSSRQLDGEPDDVQQWLRRFSMHSPGIDPRDLMGLGLSSGYDRREAWVHQRHRSEQIERVSHYVEHLRDVQDPLFLPAKQDAVVGAPNLQRAKPAEASDAKSKSENSKSIGLRDDFESSAKDWAVAKEWCAERDRISRRLSTVEEYSNALEHHEKPEDLETQLAIDSIDDQLLQLADADRPPVEHRVFDQRVPHPEPQKQRDCIVCGDGKDPLDFPPKSPTAACEHTPQTCSDCLSSWIDSEVDTKGTEGIKCPECPQTLGHNDIQRAASPTTFTKYDNLATRAALGALKDFAWCLSPTCTSGQENTSNANYMHCVACDYKQCLSHRSPWHADETCAEYDYRTSGQKRRDEEAAAEAMLDRVSKKCPNPSGCGWRIEQDGGCDHMTCRKCRWEFCWRCGASQKEIRRVGNTAHDVGCKHHSKNLEVTWPFNMH